MIEASELEAATGIFKFPACVVGAIVGAAIYLSECDEPGVVGEIGGVIGRIVAPLFVVSTEDHSTSFVSDKRHYFGD